MKFLSSDLLAIGISTIIISTFSGLLYHDFTRKIEVAEAKEIGTITYKRRIAQRKYASQVIWEDVEQNIPVYNNDSIRTSEMSEAVIHLHDGTDIQLADDSMILLAMSEGAININFSHGTLYAKRGDLAAKDVQQINIVSKEATVSIEKSDVKLSKTENKELNLNVSKGTAKIQTGKEEKTIEKDQKVTVSSDTKETKVFNKVLKPISPDPNAYFVSLNPTLPVRFTWEPVSDVRLYFEVSSSSSFARNVTSRVISSDGTVQNLSGGTTYWRLRAVDRGGRTEVSDVRKVTVIRDSMVRLINPVNLTDFTFSTKPPIVRFTWVKNEIASGYMLEISRDQSFSSIVASVKTPLTSVAVDTLGEGTYYWRVRTDVVIGGDYSGRSPVYRFVVSKKREIEPLQLIFPNNNQRLGAEMIKTKGVIFSWKASSQFNRYKISIARDAGFRNIFMDTTLTGNFYTMKKPLPAGDYFWRVIPVTAEKVTPTFSSTRKFTVIVAEKLILATPVNQSVFKLRKDQPSSPVAFSWKKVDVPGNYVFELSRDKSFIPLYRKSIIEGTSVRFNNIETGRYAWRVRLLDENRGEVIVSDIRTFSVEKPVEPVTAEKGAEKVEEAPAEKKATLIVRSPVEKSVILVNSKRVGYGSVKLALNAGEQVQIEVRTKEYFPFKRVITLREGETRSISVRLMQIKKDERVKWVERLASPVKSKPIFHNDILIVSSNDGMIYGMRKSGSRVWQTSVRTRSEATPAVSKTVFYTVTVDGYLHALSVKNGRRLWRRKLQGPLLFGSKPLVVGDQIYVATSFGVVHAFTIGGKALWQKQLEGGVYNSITHHRGVLFIGADNRRIYALSTRDGEEQWTFDVDSRMVSSAPRIYKGKLFVGTYNGTFYAIDVEDGDLEWKFKAEDAVLSTPAFFENTVYFGSVDGYLYALDSGNGDLLWKYDTDDKIMVEPMIANNLVYIPSGKTIYAMELKKGSIKWKKSFEHRIKSPATAVGNDVYVGLDNGELVSLRSDLTVVVE